jgi:phosphonate transport system substrate-binding protein
LVRGGAQEADAMRIPRGAAFRCFPLVPVAVAALLLLLVPTPTGAAEEVIRPAYRLGIIPFYTPEKIYQLYLPLVAYLNSSTRTRWELVVGKTHDELVASLCRNEVAIAFLGPIPFAKAISGQRGPKPILVSKGHDGAAYYTSVIVTADPAIRNLADLKGRKFAIFEKSTAAHYFPLKMLGEAGLAATDVTYVPLSSQDRIIAAILSNQVAAGGIKDSLFHTFEKSGLRKLKGSEPLCNFVFAASPALPPTVEREFVEALLKIDPLKNPKDSDLVKRWDQEVAYGFAVPPADFSERARQLLNAVLPFTK